MPETDRTFKRTLSPDPAATKRRRQRRERKVTKNGARPAACLLCGWDDVSALEDAHVANRVNDQDTTVVLCRNHHGANTEALLAAGVPTRYAGGQEPDPVQRFMTLMAGSAVLLADVHQQMVLWARWTDELHSTGKVPTWTPGSSTAGESS